VTPYLVERLSELRRHLDPIERFLHIVRSQADAT
jgi:hypothetical protein